MNKVKTSVLAGMLALTVFMTGCAGQGAMGGGADKVAVVNGTAITKSEYDKTYNEFSKAFNLEKMPEQQREMINETLKQMTLSKLILHTLIYNEAEKAGIQVTDADIKAYKEEKIFSKPELKEQFTAFLEQNNMSEADFDAMLKDNLLLSKFMEAKAGKAVAVSDEEVKTFYEKNAEQFKVPERIHAKHILVKAVVPEMKRELREKNPKMSEADIEKAVQARQAEAKAEAEKLYAQVKANPKKFEELAKAESDDPMSAKQGGDLGYMMEANIDPAFWAAAEKTANGKLHPGVVATPFGYHIVQVLERQAPHQENFAEAKEAIREHLSQQKKQAFLQQWAEQQKSQATIEIEPEYQPKGGDPMAAGPAAAPGPEAPAPAKKAEGPHE